MAKVPSSLIPGGNAPTGKTSETKAHTPKPPQGTKPAAPRVIKGNMASLKAMRAFRPNMAALAGNKGAQGGEELHPDVMSGEFDAEQLEKALNQGWTPKEGVEAKEEKEEREEIKKGNELEKAAKEGHAPSTGNTGKQPASRGSSVSSGNLPRAASDFNQQKTSASGVHTKLQAEQVKAAHAAEEATAAKAAAGKTLDAFALLNQAKDPGTYYKEDQHGAGHPEDLDDPELAAAVEETIRTLFGVRGIMRVAPGRNEAEEPVVVVVASHGFTDASLSKVPLKVGKFDTVLAVPYELLPLRKER